MDGSANNAYYTIQKVLFDLIVSHHQNTNEIHDQVKSFWYRQLQPGIENIFDELNPEFCLRIDKLELNLGLIPAYELSEGIFNNLMQTIKDQLLISMDQVSIQDSFPGMVHVSGSRSVNALLFYLEEGYLPWWGNELSSQRLEDEFIQAFRINESLFLKIEEILGRKEKAALRLLSFASHRVIELLFQEYKKRMPTLDRGNFIVRILETILSGIKSNEPVQGSNKERTVIRFMLLTIFSARDEDKRHKAFREVLSYLKNKEINNDLPGDDTLLEALSASKQGHQEGKGVQEDLEQHESIEKRILSEYYNIDEKIIQNSQLDLLNKEFLKDQLFSEILEKQVPYTESKSETAQVLKSFKDISGQSQQTNDFADPEHYPDAEIYINNAGLVILHPFLEKYFLTLELLENKDFKSPETQHRAAYLLQYLASDHEAFDFDMILNKVLCGIPVDTPLLYGSPVTNHEKAESNLLLESVVRNWDILQNTSIEGLREGFISRSGKLVSRHDGYQLIVEQKGHDVLLDKLKWSICIIHNPWMAYKLFVEWI